MLQFGREEDEGVGKGTLFSGTSPGKSAFPFCPRFAFWGSFGGCFLVLVLMMVMVRMNTTTVYNGSCAYRCRKV